MDKLIIKDNQVLLGSFKGDFLDQSQHVVIFVHMFHGAIEPVFIDFDHSKENICLLFAVVLLESQFVLDFLDSQYYLVEFLTEEDLYI